MGSINLRDHDQPLRANVKSLITVVTGLATHGQRDPLTCYFTDVISL